MNESIRWKVIDGYPDCEVSTTGLVRKRTQFPNLGERVKILKQQINAGGYPQVNIARTENGIVRPRTTLVHRLVGKAFVPGYKDGLEIHHKDENKLNACADNLVWVTSLGHSNIGHKQTISRKYLTPDEIQQILKCRQIGLKLDQIARAFERTVPHISALITRKSGESA